MPFADASGRMQDSLFATGGSDALWKVGGTGGGVPVKVIFALPDDDLRLGDDRLTVSTVMLKVRRSQVEQPAADDMVTIDAVTYRIIGIPKADKFRLVWLCEAEKA